MRWLLVESSIVPTTIAPEFYGCDVTIAFRSVTGRRLFAAV